MARKGNMKKYLLRFDEDGAARVLKETEVSLVHPINKIISSFHNAGIFNITKNEIADILKNGISALDGIIPHPDVEGLNPLIVPIAKKEHEKKVEIIRRDVLKLESKQLFDGTMSTDVVALDMLDFLSSGECELSQDTKDKIKDCFSEYIETPRGCELYEIQHQLAELMQKFNDKLRESENIPHKTMPISARAIRARLFPLSAFHFKHTDDDDIIITPKSINFDAEVFED